MNEMQLVQKSSEIFSWMFLHGLIELAELYKTVYVKKHSTFQ